MEFSILTYCQPKQRINKIPSTRTDTTSTELVGERTQILKTEKEDSIFTIVEPFTFPVVFHFVDSDGDVYVACK